MNKTVLAKDEYIIKLNATLERHPEYEEGMRYLDVDKRGYHLMDHRYLMFQRGEREHDFTDKPFSEALNDVGTKYALDFDTIE